MTILVLGASGMIGHKMWMELSKNYKNTYAALHHPYSHYENLEIFPEDKCISNFTAEDFPLVTRVLDELKPDIIINALGITIRKGLEDNPEYTQKINSKLPHHIDNWCKENNKWQILFSTDCVFSGASTEPYQQSQKPDATDLYGASKAEGEVLDSANTLTIRSSMVGRELTAHTELFDWLLTQPQNAQLKGFSQAMYSGVTTLQMAHYVLTVIEHHSDLRGLFQIAGPPISKYDLLCLIRDTWKRSDIKIEKVEGKPTYKILDASPFFKLLGKTPPPWKQMIEEVYKNDSIYRK